MVICNKVTLTKLKGPQMYLFMRYMHEYETVGNTCLLVLVVTLPPTTDLDSLSRSWA